ncbi:collagen alpha-1(I) chain-like [Onychomys torridus]|uniref:collagen alpha-1(I) chain-like n=1 Tax=Onychomys torridus TaxID=38674 RepID=UPI00167F1F10|nr:collagen alpha-1(I) chain-like [Onychomys torridus]
MAKKRKVGARSGVGGGERLGRLRPESSCGNAGKEAQGTLPVLERTNSSTESLHTHTGASEEGPRELLVWTPGTEDAGGESGAGGDFSVATLLGAKTCSWRGGEGARAAAHIPRPPPAQTAERAEGKGAAGEATVGGSRALRSPAWSGSAGVPGAPGVARSQPSQSGTRGPRLSHRGGAPGVMRGDQAEVTEGQARRPPPAAARAVGGCCARAPAARLSRAGRAGRAGRSVGSARGGERQIPGGCRGTDPRGAAAYEGAAHRPMAASRLGEAEATAAAGRVRGASRRPPGSTPARAAHALRPPLKGPARSRVLRSVCRAAEEVFNLPHRAQTPEGIPGAEGIVAVGREFPDGHIEEGRPSAIDSRLLTWKPRVLDSVHAHFPLGRFVTLFPFAGFSVPIHRRR